MATKKSNFKEGMINHYENLRIRMNGSGDLKLKLLSMDGVKIFIALPLTLEGVTNKEPTRKVNFTQQRAQLEIRTTAINEFFEISKIVFFMKPVAENYPG